MAKMDELGQATATVKDTDDAPGALERVEIEIADNGYLVRVWKAPKKGKKGEPMGFGEPERLVAADKAALDKILDGLFKIED